MVRKISDQGGVYHEPPYTEEEELELYRQMGGVRAFTRRAPAAANPAPSPQDPPPSASE